MSGRLVALVVVILAFGALSFMALVEVGYLGVFLGPLESWAGTQVLVDLVIVCVLAIIWMVRDAKTSGVNPWPFVAVTLAAGSFGVLFYLVAREVKAGAAARPEERGVLATDGGVPRFPALRSRSDHAAAARLTAHYRGFLSPVRAPVSPSPAGGGGAPNGHGPGQAMSEPTDDKRTAGEDAAHAPKDWDFSRLAAEAARRNATTQGETPSWNEQDFARISASPRRAERTGAQRKPPAARFRDRISRAALPRVRLPQVRVPEILLPRARLPRPRLPRMELPKIALPQIRFPRLRLPRVRLPQVRIPQVQLPQVRMPRIGARMGAAGNAVRDGALGLLRGAIIVLFRALWFAAVAAAGVWRAGAGFLFVLLNGGERALVATGRFAQSAARAALRITVHVALRTGSLFAGKGPQWRAGAFAAAGFGLAFIAVRNGSVEWREVAEAPLVTVSVSAPVSAATAEHLIEAYRVPLPLARIPYRPARRVAVAQAPERPLADADVLARPFNLPGTQRGRNYRAAIAEAQVRLLRLGYAAGAPTGEQTPRTSRALALFQKSAGLPVTGTADMATIEQLRRASAS